MKTISKKSHLVMLAALTMSASGVYAQQQSAPNNDINVLGQKNAGPELKGFISARNDEKMQVTSADGAKTVVLIDEATKIKASSGLFGSGKGKPTPASLLNGLPVTVKTWQTAEGTLIANQIVYKNGDFKTANMIRSGTAQGSATRSL